MTAWNQAMLGIKGGDIYNYLGNELMINQNNKSCGIRSDNGIILFWWFRLAAGELPAMPVFSGWADCFKHLRKTVMVRI